MGAVDDGLNMVFGGSTDPVALVEVAALGLSAAHSRSLAGPISSLVTQHFNVPGARIYVRFQDSERSMWAWNGNTFG